MPKATQNLGKIKLDLEPYFEYIQKVRNSFAIACSGAVLIFAVFAAWRSIGVSDSLSLSAVATETSQGGRTTSVSDSAPYRSSVVGTDFDFITQDDPSTFDHLEFVGFQEFEMPDKREHDEPLVQNAYVFEASFTDGTKIKIALDQDFGSREAAELSAAEYAPRLGKLPSLYRRGIRHITVNFEGSDTTAFAEDKGHFFTIYSGNASRRIGTHDLEETFFHEGTHASIQDAFLESAEWRSAVSRDAAYITEYAKTSEQEDFAESALFAYTIINHPERFPDNEREKIVNTIPNRIDFFRRVFSGELEMPTDSSTD